ncbi:hypothetical protein [Psychromonas sp. MME2]|uniref:hypothetical protein n=1 Tax=unclassified Psychromonas TaxID=2614957 RepID=UPI00339CAEA5
MMKAIFITGQSNRRCCQLSPKQKKIADFLEEEGVSVAPFNFPYDSQMNVYHETNLLNASLSNTLQYFLSRKPHFEKQYRAQVIKQFEQYGYCIVMAGSCGLELLNNLHLPVKLLKNMHVIAYGPVARTLPKTQVTMIQGRNDWLSKLFFKEVDYLVDCGHMDYLESTEILNVLQQVICSIKKNQMNNIHEKCT